MRWISAVACAGLLLVTGCSDSTGPVGTGQVQFVLAGGGSSSAQLSRVSASEGETAAAAVTLADVSSIEVTVVGVEALRAGGSGTQGSPWVSLGVEDGGEVDLLSLGQAGIELAAGEVPAGTYINVRLYLEGATITFEQDVLVGQQLYEAGEPHELTIPSAEQTGIKTVNVSFEVPDGGVVPVVLEFDAAASVQNLAATGSGAIIMNPVLTQAGS